MSRSLIIRGRVRLHASRFSRSRAGGLQGVRLWFHRPNRYRESRPLRIIELKRERFLDDSRFVVVRQPHGHPSRGARLDRLTAVIDDEVGFRTCNQFWSEWNIGHTLYSNSMLPFYFVFVKLYDRRLYDNRGNRFIHRIDVCEKPQLGISLRNVARYHSG